VAEKSPIVDAIVKVGCSAYCDLVLNVVTGVLERRKSS